MPQSGSRWRRALIALGLGLGATLVALLAGRLAFVRTVDWKLYDQHVRWTADPATARRDIVLVAIDETSIRRLEPVVGRWPWPRLVHAALIDFLARGPARVVGYDVLFTEHDRRSGFDVGGETWTGANSDQAFADSVARAANVVLLADATFEGLEDPQARAGAVAPAASSDGATTVSASPSAASSTFEERPHVLLPYEALARAARALGHNFLVLDPDGPVRRIVPYVRHEGRQLPALGVAAYSVAQRLDPASASLTGHDLRLGTRHVPVVIETLPRFEGAPAQSSARMLLDLRGPATLDDGRTTTYRRYSFYDLFYSEQQLLAGEVPFVDPDVFRDAVVMVGVTAAGLHDIFVTSFGGGGKMPGSQIHAAVVDQLLSNRFRQPAPAGIAALAVAGAGALSALAFVFLRARSAALAIALVVGALVAASVSAFERGHWLPLASPLLAAATAGVSGLAYRYLAEGREKRAVKRLFSRYLSRDVYEQVLANPALAELGGKRREMSVLFSDIRGFTAITERGEPEALVTQLNEYFSRMVEIVFAHRGTLDKFVGDMVMALFGAPLDDPDHAEAAVKAALAMVDELARLNQKWAAEGRPQLGIGIGINSGDMIAGNIGSESVRSYTVIGDNVNLAARLESLNKDYATSIIISEHTAHRLPPGYDLRPLGEVVVKGKSVAVAIFEVVAGSGQRREPGVVLSAPAVVPPDPARRHVSRSGAEGQHA
jgi:adenylate cyclase